MPSKPFYCMPLVNKAARLQIIKPNYTKTPTLLDLFPLCGVLLFGARRKNYFKPLLSSECYKFGTSICVKVTSVHHQFISFRRGCSLCVSLSLDVETLVEMIEENKLIQIDV